MKKLLPLILITLSLASCTSQKKLAYLNNLSRTDGQEYFTMDVPDYKIQPRDILYITAKALTPDGRIEDLLIIRNTSTTSQTYGEAGSYLYGYDVNSEGNIRLPSIGLIKVEGYKLEEARDIIQKSIDKVFKDATVECKLLSFKFTVIGEVKSPGAYINYNNYLTVLEAIGRAGGIGDYGNRNRVLVVRPTEKGSNTFRLNLQDKQLLQSEAYFILPNDVIIVETQKNKIFNMNLPTIGFIMTTITSTITITLLLMEHIKN